MTKQRFFNQNNTQWSREQKSIILNNSYKIYCINCLWFWFWLVFGLYKTAVFCSMNETFGFGLPPWFSISNSALKGNSLKKIITFIEILWNFIKLKMDVVICVSHAQLFSVPYVCLCSLYTEKSMNYFVQKLTFPSNLVSFSSSKIIFQRFQLISQLGLKFRHVFQLRTEVQFYKAVNTKSSLKVKAFFLILRPLHEERSLRCYIN